MNAWNYDPLWQKAKLYVNRALAEDRAGPLFPFWASLAFELLARATLARIHPVLLAEPDCLLEAFGYDSGTKAKSIMSKTVFLRLQKIVDGFGEQELKKSMSIVNRRNEELHTGTLAFDELPTKLWLSDYFRISKLLLSFQGRSLADFLGAQEAMAAEKMIDASEQEMLAFVKKTVGEKKAAFEALDAQERELRHGNAAAAVKKCADLSKNIVKCPACAASAVVTGEQVRAGEPRLQNEMMYRDLAFLPTGLSCQSCDLQLAGHACLHAAGLGGQYALTEKYDPVEFYGEQLLQAMADDAAYMNE